MNKARDGMMRPAIVFLIHFAIFSKVRPREGTSPLWSLKPSITSNFDGKQTLHWGLVSPHTIRSINATSVACCVFFFSRNNMISNFQSMKVILSSFEFLFPFRNKSGTNVIIKNLVRIAESFVSELLLLSHIWRPAHHHSLPRVARKYARYQPNLTQPKK